MANLRPGNSEEPSVKTEETPEKANDREKTDKVSDKTGKAAEHASSEYAADKPLPG
jgi:hypothetical protein